jgi:glyoxylase-like metal-dependent hydrolase (beta-lactamase superfamily II)
MPRFERMSRRTFIADLGRAAVGIVVLGAAACASDDTDDAAATSTATSSAGSSPASALGGWHRANLGIVSAYILVRGGEGYLVDTGVAGKASDIEAVLSDAGSSWKALGHLILTHKHPDHIGSAAEIAKRATEATIYAGEADIPAIKLSRDITAVGDGADVGGLRIVATPGHTPGHVGVLDTTSRVFVTGDAVVGQDGGVGPPGAQYTEDMDVAMRSLTKVGKLDFDIALFGHGDPVTSDANAKIAALADA